MKIPSNTYRIPVTFLITLWLAYFSCQPARRDSHFSGTSAAGPGKIDIRDTTDSTDYWNSYKSINDGPTLEQYRKNFFSRDTVIRLDSGLYYREYLPKVKSDLSGNYPVIILKIDPAFYTIHLLIGREYGTAIRGNGSDYSFTAGKWLKITGYIAAINAGMFGLDSYPSGFTKLDGNILNGEGKAGFNHVLVFNENGTINVNDPECGSAPGKIKTCTTIIRMLRCDSSIAWAKQPDKQWSTACIALDKKGMVYFIHSRTALMVYDLTAEIMEAIPEVSTISYLEGGPEASLSILIPGFKKDFCGSYESGFSENDAVTGQWGIPNIIGILKR